MNRTKHTVFAVLGVMLVTSLSACQEQSTPDQKTLTAPIYVGEQVTAREPVVAVSASSKGHGDASVEFIERRMDPERNWAAFDVIFEGQPRTLTFQGQTSTHGKSYTARVDDEDGERVWEQGFAFNQDGSLRSVYETDGFERLDVSVARVGDETTETYHWVGLEDGDRLETFTFTEATQDRERSRWLDWQPKASSLNHHPEGVLVNRILLGQVESELLPQPRDQNSVGNGPAAERGEVVCQAAAGCVLTKCPFGGGANPICVGCTVVVVGCVFCAIFSWC